MGHCAQISNEIEKLHELIQNAIIPKRKIIEIFCLNSFPNIEGKIMKYYKAANQLVFLCCQKGAH